MAKKKKNEKANNQLDEKLMNKSLAGIDNFGIPEEEEEIVDVDPMATLAEKKRKELRDRADKLRKESNTIEPIIFTESGGVKKASELTLDEQDDEIVRCASNPIYFIETYLTIFDQTQGDGGMIVPFKMFEFQKDLVRSYMQNKFNIANKYRQAGISTTTCAYLAWYTMFSENRTVAIVANKLQTARDELMRDVVEFINNCPKFLRITAIHKDTAAHKIYNNNSQIGAFSSKGLRGYTPTLIFWDETAWTEKGDVFWAGTRPSLQTGGRCIMVSTPNGLDAVFYKTFYGATQKKNNFNSIELWWYNDPRYAKGLEWIKNKGNEDEIRLSDTGFDKEKRQQLITDGWEPSSLWFETQVADYNGDMRKVAQELLCSFLGSGDNFVSEEVLKRVEENDKLVPIKQEWSDKNMWIWEEPLLGEDYLIAGDVSSGYSDDSSVATILKVKEVVEEKIIIKNNIPKKMKVRRRTLEQVAEYMGKVTPQEFAEIIYYYGKRYNMAYCAVDISGGYGIGTIEKLKEFGYENIHYSEMTNKPLKDRLSSFIKTVTKQISPSEYRTIDMLPGFTISSNRGMVLQEMERAIRMGDAIIRSVRLLNEFKTFVREEGSRVADHKRSFHDDAIMAIAIGIYVGSYDMKRLNGSPEKTKKMIDAMMSIRSDEVIVENHETGDDEIQKMKKSKLI
ncbi:MAG: hypothetical protein HC836_36405 [Richelia sp. RM2_1_2]|nr:hypothetical protein [Richelia sp. RM2_1_2]